MRIYMYSMCNTNRRSRERKNEVGLLKNKTLTVKTKKVRIKAGVSG